MRKIVKIYVPTGCITNSVCNGDRLGYTSREAAEKAVYNMGNLKYFYPDGMEIIEKDFELPSDSFWTNDLISVELHRGGAENEDGISSGGDWQKPVHGLVHVTAVWLHSGEVEGWIFEPGTDKFIQSMVMKSGKNGFPYRAAKLIRANNVESFQ